MHQVRNLKPKKKGNTSKGLAQNTKMKYIKKSVEWFELDNELNQKPSVEKLKVKNQLSLCTLFTDQQVGERQFAARD